MVIIDTNIIAYLFLPMELTNKAEDLFVRDSVWITSPLWKYEFYSIITRYLRTGKLNKESALLITEKADKLLEDRTYNPLKKTVFEIINTITVSAYDAEFLALARELKQPLITADNKLLKKAPELTLSL